MNKSNDILPLIVDTSLAEEIRKDFTALVCTKALMQSAAEMARAIGVEVSWEIGNIDPDKEVDKSELTKALSRLATAGGAVLMGGKINPIRALGTHDPMKGIRKTVDTENEK